MVSSVPDERDGKGYRSLGRARQGIMPFFSLDCGGGASGRFWGKGIYERARKGQILFGLMKKAVDGFGGPAYNPRLAAAVARE